MNKFITIRHDFEMISRSKTIFNAMDTISMKNKEFLFMLILFVLPCLVILYMQYMVNKVDMDTDAKLYFNKKERISIIILLLMTMLIISKEFKGYIDQIFFSVYLAMLLVNGIIDARTKSVYRFFSVLSFTIGFVYLCIKIVTKGFPEDRLTTFLITQLAYWVIIHLLEQFRVIGLGDAIILDGCSFFILIIMINTPLFMIESLLIHFILANIAFMIVNVRDIDWRKMKAKEETAFVPGIYIATCFMLAVDAIVPQLYTLFVF